MYTLYYFEVFSLFACVGYYFLSLDLEELPCDGDPPLVNETSGVELYCGEGPAHLSCPAGSYCHISVAGGFAKCCRDGENGLL